jgi:1,4-alpha-glucan branching enzyme
MELNPAHRPCHHYRLSFSLVYAFPKNFVQVISHDEVVHGKGSLLNKMSEDEWQKNAHLCLYFCYQFGHPKKTALHGEWVWTMEGMVGSAGFGLATVREPCSPASAGFLLQA